MKPKTISEEMNARIELLFKYSRFIVIVLFDGTFV